MLIKALDDSHLGDCVNSKAAQICPNRPTEGGHMNKKPAHWHAVWQMRSQYMRKPYSVGET